MDMRRQGSLSVESNITVKEQKPKKQLATRKLGILFSVVTFTAVDCGWEH
jgi:hypothetical protein